MASAAGLISQLDLQPHPEGGWYRENYRATELIPEGGLPERFAGPRSFATSIYFLLTSDSFSALHRIKSDEQWHFYAGDRLMLHLLEPPGGYRRLFLGPNLGAGEDFQAVVPAGCWFGATVPRPGSFALVGCTVAPGFNFADFELGRRTDLVRLFPQHQELITRLTRS